MSRKFGLPGKVYLLGVGKGSVSSLASRALPVLQQAEVAMYDALVSQEVLDQLPKSCLVLNLGQEGYKNAFTPEQLNDRMIAYADEGKIVVRLVSTEHLDRLREEMQAIRAAGINLEVVSSAAKVPATAVAA
jgi:siroheme synthase